MIRYQGVALSAVPGHSSIRPFLKLSLLAVFVVLACLTGEADAQTAVTRTIRDDGSGGDCAQVGTWDATARTCTLMVDSGERFVINADYVTLDGNGHTLTGGGPADGGGGGGAGDGVLIPGRTGVTVRNLTVRQFDYGIRVQDSIDATITGNTTTNNAWVGISVHNSSGSLVTGNTVSNLNMDTGIFVGFGAGGNTLSGNDISGTERGIFLYDQSNNNSIDSNSLSGAGWGVSVFSSIGNSVINNTITAGSIGVLLRSLAETNSVSGNVISSNGTGLQVDNASGNELFNNELTDNAVQAVVLSGGGNVFSRPKPDGGNLWNDYDSAAEGCSDADGDGFCDAAYVFSGGSDGLAKSSELPITVRTIRDDASGGDCAQVGTWDATARTCTLMVDSGERFVINADYVTLDGNGHTLTGGGPADGGGGGGAGDGVLIPGRTGVTVRNLTVRQFDYGIRVQDSIDATITGNTASNSAWVGISVHNSSGSLVSGNTVSNLNMDTGIFVGFSASGNTVSGNDISGTERGIFHYGQSNNNDINNNSLSGAGWGVSIFASTGNSISGNTIASGTVGVNIQNAAHSNAVSANNIGPNNVGTYINASSNNSFYGNEFLNNPTQVSLGSGTGNSFSQPAPTGGNHWSSFDIPAEGCVNIDADGFCDAPYTVVSGVVDNLPVTPNQQQPYTTRIIRNDATGGDCSLIGSWDAATSTCTLAADLTDNFVIASNNVTLDGGGHTLTGSGPASGGGPGGSGDAVNLEQRAGVTVRNLIIKQYDYAIHLVDSNNNSVNYNTTYNNAWAGISLSGATANTISDNHVSNLGMDTGICVGFQSSNNTFLSNIIENTERGLYFHDQSNSNNSSSNTLLNNYWGFSFLGINSGNSVSGNTIDGSYYGVNIHDYSISNTITGNSISNNTYGVYLNSALDNTVNRNDFIDNLTQALVEGGSGNIFSHPAPGGGNYWNDFDTPAEGCIDGDADGFCDAAYSFGGGADSLPWNISARP